MILHRLQIFQEIAPGLNRLLCFATFVGSWKEITPQQVIAVKRQTDEAMYANRPLFSDELFAAYQEFMASQFATYAVTGGDALLRARISSQWGNRRDLPWWEGSLERLFAADDPASTDRVQAAYHKLSEAFRADLYVTRDAETILGARSARLVQPGRLAAAEVTE